MKLTNFIRDAFIDSVMNDVPKIDYASQARKAFLDAHIAALPKGVQTLWASNELRPYLQTNTAHLCNASFAFPSADRYSNAVVPAAAKSEVERIEAAHCAQRQARAALRTTLKGAAYACTTTKALRELLPEFDRYLPAEAEKTSRQLPVVQNIMADFVKAGWPANKKGAKA
jgi:hypothetical protein